MMDGHIPIYVRQDEHGALRVGDTGVMLDSVIAAWEQGHSPESIRSQYPSLSLELVYGAITWCLSHPDEVAAYVKQQEAVWEKWRKHFESPNDPVRQRLAALARANQVQPR